nr:FecR domain-containing protein [Oscillatoria laete-virens]
MIQVSGKGNWAAPEVSKAYPTGSGARTSSSGPMLLQFDPKNLFRLLPGAEVVIRAPKEEGKLRRVAIDLKQGEVSLTLDQVPSGYQIEVQTPTAVCGAVGTHFSVSYSPKTGSSLNQKFACSRGEVFARSSVDQSFTVRGITAGKTVSAAVLPGKENAANSLQLPAGVRVNVASASASGYSFQATGSSTVDIAKDVKNNGQALMVVRSGKAGNLSPGSYLVEGGAANAVPKEKLSTAGEYWNLARQEGALRARINAGERGLEAELNRVAAEATKKRRELFDRALIRDTVRDSMPRPGR